MKAIFVLAILSAVATLIVMMMGVMTMGKTEKKNQRRGQKLMRARVTLQFTTLILLILAAATA